MMCIVTSVKTGHTQGWCIKASCYPFLTSVLSESEPDVFLLACMYTNIREVRLNHCYERSNLVTLASFETQYLPCSL